MIWRTVCFDMSIPLLNDVFLLLTCRFNVGDHPELCMAYKIPPGIQVDIVVKISQEDSSSSQWYYMAMSAGSTDVQKHPRLTLGMEFNADNQLVNSMNSQYFTTNAFSRSVAWLWMSVDFPLPFMCLHLILGLSYLPYNSGGTMCVWTCNTLLQWGSIQTSVTTPY